MTPDEELLGHRSISELEDAERRLRTHVRARRRALRPSTTRRIVGLFFSMPMAIAGSALLFWGLTTGHFLGLHMVSGIFLLLGSGAWIYCDWVE